MKINVMLDGGAYMPEKAHEDDAGYDLRTPIDFAILPTYTAVIDTGVHVEIPKGYVGFLKSKSGLNIKNGIRSEGVIDSGYTGSIKVNLYNDGKKGIKFNAGDKITQLVFLPIPETELVLTNKFAPTERGNNGFGGTGR